MQKLLALMTPPVGLAAPPASSVIIDRYAIGGPS